MSYVGMLRRWRMTPLGNPLFMDESGDYFKKVMFEKKAQLTEDEQVTASKTVGWDKAKTTINQE
jgi:hypothetical protein